LCNRVVLRFELDKRNGAREYGIILFFSIPRPYRDKRSD
jgi:hypothetical protein